MCVVKLPSNLRGKFYLLIKKCYELHFGCKVGDRHTSWAPHICCITCVKLLTGYVIKMAKQALRVPGRWGSQISRQSAHEGGKVVSHTHRLLLSPRKYCRYSFLLQAGSILGHSAAGRIMSLKIPVTP